MASKLEDLNISRDELSRITEALKKEEFRKMFIDYVQELNDPENRKVYEAELTQLELERGVDVKFINPEGGFVIKTSVDGSLKCFINVAKCDKIDKPTSECVTNSDGLKGLSWKLPYSQAQPRKDVDRAGKPAMVYDVVFHPDTVYMAEKNLRFKKLVVDTACDAVSQAFGVVIDKTNLKFPKMLFKGTPQPTLIRKANGKAPNDTPSPLDKIYPTVHPEKAEVRKSTELPPAAEYTVPKYQVTHRRDIEYHELTDEMDAKLNVLTPRELVVSIDLPLLSSTKDVNLDVMPNKLVLVSEVPAKYKLDLKLPCTVLERNGSAKFDKDTRKLVVTLPVLQQKKNMAELMREDSGVECGGDSTWNESSVDSVSSEEDDEAFESVETEKKLIAAIETDSNNCKTALTIPPIAEAAAVVAAAEACQPNAFLNPNLNYQLPHFNLNGIDNIAAFTLHVKNVEPSSIVVDQKPDRKSLHLKFSSIGSGFYPVHYAFYLQIPTDNTATVEEVTTEAWDNNLILQLELNLDNGDDAFRTYFAGLDCNNLISYNVTEKLGKNHTNLGKAIEDDSLSIEVTETTPREFSFEIKNEKVKKLAGKVDKQPDKKLRSMSESYCDELKIINELECLEIESAKRPKNKNKNRNKELEKQQKMRSISESSSDEHISTKSTNASTSLATNTANNQRKYKSILKRCSFDRSISECSMDLENLSYTASSMDYGIGSFDNSSNVAQSHDSDFAGGESCKKTVRFSDKIKRQLFRSDVSILHKRQKNIKRRMKQQRALVRRHSEGSEGDHEYNEKESDNGHETMEKYERQDSGVDETTANGAGNKNSAAVKIKDGNNKKNKRKSLADKQDSVEKCVDMEFKSGMIFDLEM